jgi:Lrp/AsnC family transcriptional regulator, leucine-responsive regulatory protein
MNYPILSYFQINSSQGAQTMEDADLRILRRLQTDGRLSNQDLAQSTGLSASACWRRVKALEDARVIAGYVALVEPGPVGLEFAAIVHVSLVRHERAHVDQFIQAIVGRREVLECFATTGEADYHLRVVCTDKDSYNHFLDEFLFRLPGIAHIRTNLVLKQIKMTTQLPI